MAPRPIPWILRPGFHSFLGSPACDSASLWDTLELMLTAQDSYPEGGCTDLGAALTVTARPVGLSVIQFQRYFHKPTKSPSSLGRTFLSIILMHRLHI